MNPTDPRPLVEQIADLTERLRDWFYSSDLRRPDVRSIDFAVEPAPMGTRDWEKWEPVVADLHAARTSTEKARYAKAIERAIEEIERHHHPAASPSAAGVTGTEPSDEAVLNLLEAGFGKERVDPLRAVSDKQWSRMDGFVAGAFWGARYRHERDMKPTGVEIKHEAERFAKVERAAAAEQPRTVEPTEIVAHLRENASKIPYALPPIQSIADYIERTFAAAPEGSPVPFEDTDEFMADVKWAAEKWDGRAPGQVRRKHPRMTTVELEAAYKQAAEDDARLRGSPVASEEAC